MSLGFGEFMPTMFLRPLEWHASASKFALSRARTCLGMRLLSLARLVMSLCGALRRWAMSSRSFCSAAGPSQRAGRCAAAAAPSRC
eukprot:2608603-Pyramimonas_sp.AAC.1